MSEDGYRKYRDFFERPPQIVVEWNDTDPGTKARGWLVINSLLNGAAGGGTRMKSDATREDALFLAKTMEIKFRVSGPSIGGAKSVIDFDPKDPRKHEVLKRWFESIGALLKGCYGTGGDQNVQEGEVIALTEATLRLGHPQEGIVRGHFKPDEKRLASILEQLGEGVQKSMQLPGKAAPFALSKLVTGYGVAKAIEAYYRQTGGSARGKRVIIEGFGDVGGPAAYYLRQMGARIVGIICMPSPGRFRWRVDPDGLDIPAELLASREGADLPAGGSQEGDEEATAAEFWRQPADIFIPAATSYTVTQARLELLRAAGVRVIACGANTPFADRKPGEYGVQAAADQSFDVIPDFIANCGMARTFAYLMQEGVSSQEDAILADVETTISSAMEKLLAGYSGGGGLLNRAFSHYIP
ncbi:MAG TPA: Glu/Leu/Phe/Val dehydrogenase dimerization domain-containing protein [Thermoanaerobaculia bacterium]